MTDPIEITATQSTATTTPATTPVTPTRGVPVTLAGRTYKLRYRPGDIRRIEEATGGKLFDGTLFSHMSMGDLLGMVYHGLTHLKDPNITMEFLDDELDLEDVKPMLDGITALLQKAFPQIAQTAQSTAQSSPNRPSHRNNG